MATVTLKGAPVEIEGKLPERGKKAPPFTLVQSDLSEAGLGDFPEKYRVLNIFPSLDTSTCAASVRAFNEKLSRLGNAEVLCISADLPFAARRFCSAEGLERVRPLSTFRSPRFGRDYGVEMTTGPLKGLLGRAVVVVDPAGKVVHSQLVPEIADEPDYEAALRSIP